MKQIIILLLLSIFLNTMAFGNLLQVEKQKYQAKGVAVVIVDSVSNSAYMMYEKSSEKGSPKRLTRDYLFEPGNAMIPISFALLLDKNSKWSNTKMIDCRNIDIKKEDCKENYAKDAIVYSSSRIVDMITAHLKADDLYNGLQKFGFTHIPSFKKLKQNIYKTLCARGYGIQTNLLELTKAYTIFSYSNNIINKKTAKEMRKLLIEAVKKGTGKNAQVKGMLIGGKTGTALMVNKKTKRYYNHYNATFIGFAKGKGHKYTIGVLVIDPKVGKLASKTAVNVFKDVVNSLLNNPFELGKREYKKGNLKK